MIKQHLTAAVAACIIFLSSGCNNDVFIDEPDIPEITEATIEGDGGETEFVIPSKGLERISLDLMSETQKYCTYYNPQGEEISKKSPASELGSIVFDNDFNAVKIIKSGNRLTVRSICRTFQGNGTWSIRLDYDYGVRFIDVHVLPGKPLKLADVDYTSEMKIDDKAEVKTYRTVFTNNGSDSQIMEEYPYIQAAARLTVEPDPRSPWGIYDESVTLKVPVYKDGTWVLTEMHDIRPGARYDHYRPDQMMAVDIEVPANSKVTVVTGVTYSKAEIKGTMTFLNEVLDRTISAGFTATSTYPVSYEIRHEIAK